MAKTDFSIQVKCTSRNEREDGTDVFFQFVDKNAEGAFTPIAGRNEFVLAKQTEQEAAKFKSGRIYNFTISELV